MTSKTSKKCSQCGEEKEFSSFHKRKVSSDGYNGKCKQCVNGNMRTGYDAEVQRERNLRRKYGITTEEYEELFKFQNGVCAMCGKPCATGRRLAVDHDHETGAVRGLLCSNCNRRVVGNLTTHQVHMMYSYMHSPPADRAFGHVKYVPLGMEKPKRTRRRRRATSRRRIS